MFPLKSNTDADNKVYVDDVFQVVTRTGTGTDVVTTTGVDMTKGYMLWSKSRSAATDHAIYDSARGVTYDLASNTTAVQTTQATGLKAVSTTGYTIGSLAKMNTAGETYVDFVFRKAPKFFDVVTWSGNGVAGRQIPHSVGSLPGMVIVKRTDSADSWCVWLPVLGTNGLLLNSNAASTAYSFALADGLSRSTASSLLVNTTLNATGASYVAYLFAHDPSAEGIIQCGSFTTDASGNATVNLGWEPQYILTKGLSTGQPWCVLDVMRGYDQSATDAVIYANTANPEFGQQMGNPTSTGFIATHTSSQTYIYIAIRRPNKPPTSGTEVYNAIARTGTGAAATVTGVGFAPDLVNTKARNSTQYGIFSDRLRGKAFLYTPYASVEAATTTEIIEYGVDGVSLGNGLITNSSSATYINHFFRRAPGVFDVVCYTGTGVAHSEPHNLGVVPELIIVKHRGDTKAWGVYHKDLGNTKFIYLNSSGIAYVDSLFWNNTTPTASVFTVGSVSNVNGTAGTPTGAHVAYLFATKAGISKVGSYTGNGTSQNIDCGFTTGARFVLIKATSTTGNWNVGDSTRGLIAGSDPLLYLNTTAAEVTTDDWLDPYTQGFTVNETASAHANTAGVTYLVLAFS